MHKTMATSRHSITKFHNTENEDSDSFSRGEKTQFKPKGSGAIMASILTSKPGRNTFFTEDLDTCEQLGVLNSIYTGIRINVDTDLIRVMVQLYWVD